MPNTFPENSLVLYKNQPARVHRTNDKLDIQLTTGRVIKVRPKDIQLLHPGPLKHLHDLTPQRGDVQTAWELLAGETTTLADLAELLFDAYTPATAWAAWQLVADKLYFSGSPEHISARNAEEVAAEKKARAAKTAKKQAWANFVQRVQRGNPIQSQDHAFLVDVEALALKRQPKNQLLHELGHAETPDNAHALLLELGYWDVTRNPYPQRLGVNTTTPSAPLPALPDEPRTDLTHLNTFAIDDADSNDPDDALSLEGNRFWVHIADAAALVTPDSPADRTARARGANLYLPEDTVPMLPPAATQLLALGLCEVSPALSFGLDFNDAGEINRIEIVPSWIKVTRLTYGEVENRLEEEPFQRMHRLAQIARNRRLAHGAIELNLPEVKVRVKHGQVQLRPLPRLRSRDLVREAMLMCGEQLAQFAQAENIPFPFTTQQSPEKSDLPDGLAGMFARRRMMKRGETRAAAAPHAGLGLPMYTQVTSPLRRYVDLLAHQQLRAHLWGGTILSAAQVTARIAEATTANDLVRQAERLSNRHWTLVYLLQHNNWCGEGIIVDKLGSRYSILIPALNLEIRKQLSRDFPLNSAVTLTLTDVHLPTLDAYFRVSD